VQVQGDVRPLLQKTQNKRQRLGLVRRLIF